METEGKAGILKMHRNQGGRRDIDLIEAGRYIRFRIEPNAPLVPQLKGSTLPLVLQACKEKILR